jgi:hypothetical protein
VFIEGAEWENNKVDRPRVVKSPDGWVMIYQAGTSVEMRGLAISNNGIGGRNILRIPSLTKMFSPSPMPKHGIRTCSTMMEFITTLWSLGRWVGRICT